MLRAQPLSTARLLLEPLRVEHAVEMAALLDDPALHTFIGGKPASTTEMRQRYERQVVGRSPDGSQDWLNWVIRLRTDNRPVGTVQATVTDESGESVAEVAWVVGALFHRRGYAREAAGAIVDRLADQGVAVVRANIHPAHEASQGVARAVGMVRTEVVVDGETRWQV